MIITDRISTIIFFENKIARLIQEISPSDSIKIFSGTDEAMEYFISIDNGIRPISIVRNTIFKCDRPEDTHDQFYSYGMREKWYQKKKKLIDNGVQWNDLGIEIHEKIVDDFIAWTKKENRRKYFYRITDVEFPCVNFLQLTFKDGSQEVLFGWAYSYYYPGRSTVFRSSNIHMCQYFADMFVHVENNYTKQ